MQRLFTTFPNSWPGAGLLLLRIACAFPLILDGLSMLSGGSGSIAIWLRLVGLLPAILLLLGLYTPVAALLQLLVELSLTLAVPSATALHLTRAAVGVALMGLGPGACSLDSRLYGRKRIDL
jgi:putative oxidoreductase